MQISLATLLGLLVATTLAAPAPESHPEAEAKVNVLEARANPSLRFYDKLDFKEPLCSFIFSDNAVEDGSCIRTPECARNKANSVRLEDGVKECSFFRQSDCEGTSDRLENDGNLRILLRDNLGSFRCDLP